MTRNPSCTSPSCIRWGVGDPPPKSRRLPPYVPSSTQVASQLPPLLPFFCAHQPQIIAASGTTRLTPSLESFATIPIAPNRPRQTPLPTCAPKAFHLLSSGAWSRFARRRLTYSTTATVPPSLGHLRQRLILSQHFKKIASGNTFTGGRPAPASVLRTADRTAQGSSPSPSPSPPPKLLRFVHHSTTYT